MQLPEPEVIGLFATFLGCIAWIRADIRVGIEKEISLLKEGILRELDHVSQAADFCSSSLSQVLVSLARMESELGTLEEEVEMLGRKKRHEKKSIELAIPRG